MNIKEIALRIAESIDDGSGEQYFVDQDGWITEFAEALIAEVAKGNEPCAFLHEWIEYHPFGDTFAGKRCAAITSDEKPFDSSDTVSPLFNFPPDKAQIEQETAEAIAEYMQQSGIGGKEGLIDGWNYYFPESPMSVPPVKIEIDFKTADDSEGGTAE